MKKFDRGDLKGLSKYMNECDQAFPLSIETSEGLKVVLGLSRRDYFAGLAPY